MRLKKIIKAFVPYGILWLYDRKIRNRIDRLLPKKLRTKLYLDSLRQASPERLKTRKLLRFEVNITDHCNLNCIGCEHFSPLSKEKYIDVGDYERDCAQLGKLLNWEAENIHLMGGEPLLHPRINEIIEITRKYFVKGVIEIVTNGILLMKQEDSFWEICRENNIVISVTRYPININHEEIEAMAKNNDVEFRYYAFEKNTMQKRPFDLEGKQDIEENIKICHMVNNCVQLRDGKLFTCVEIAYISIFNEYFDQHLEVTEKDYVDIYKVKNKREIFNFLNKPVPFCRYCNILGIEQGIKWRRSKKEINEWT